MDFNTIKASITEATSKGLSKAIEFIEKIDGVQTPIKTEEEIKPKKESRDYEDDSWFNDIGIIPKR